MCSVPAKGRSKCDRALHVYNLVSPQPEYLAKPQKGNESDFRVGRLGILAVTMQYGEISVEKGELETSLADGVGLVYVN
jgi:hypothetical protein